MYDVRCKMKNKKTYFCFVSQPRLRKLILLIRAVVAERHNQAFDANARGWGFKTCSFSNAYNETLFLSGQAVSRMCMPRWKFLFAHEHKLRLSIFELSQRPRRVYISFMCGPAFLKTYCLCMWRICIHMCQPSKSVHVWMWYMAIYCYVKSGDLAQTYIWTWNGTTW